MRYQLKLDNNTTTDITIQDSDEHETTLVTGRFESAPPTWSARETFATLLVAPSHHTGCSITVLCDGMIAHTDGYDPRDLDENWAKETKAVKERALEVFCNVLQLWPIHRDELRAHLNW